MYCPTLLIVEVAAAVSRALGDAQRATDLSAALNSLPNQTLVPLDTALANHAAVASQYGTTLVTLDRQQLERLPPTVKALTPGDALCEVQARFETPKER